MIDIPIGLPEGGYRQCDLDARKKVGPSVFLGARWNIWAFPNYKAANEHYHSIGEKGISMQLWCLRGKLKEANEGMTPERQSRLLETHPELVFWRLNRERRHNLKPVCLDKKKNAVGRQQRIAMLKENGFDQVETWLNERNGTGIGRDDLIDACVCALAARESVQTVPTDHPPKDARGIRMEMWF